MTKKETKAELYKIALKYKKKKCKSVLRTKKSMQEYLNKYYIDMEGLSVAELKKQTKKEYNKRCPAISKMRKARLKLFNEEYAIKRIRFAQDVKKYSRQRVKPPRLIPKQIKKPMRKIMKSRKKILKGISKRMPESRKIAKLLYREIPTQEKYVNIMIHNDNVIGKELRKKEPLLFIRIKGTRLKIIPSFKMKYIIKDNLKGKIFAKVVGGNKKKFKYDPEDDRDGYGADYKAKTFIVKEYRKIFKKRKIS